jgi:hypothetical protein
VLGRRGDREGGERSVLDIGQGLARRSRRREEKVWPWSRLGRKIAQHLNQILLCKNNSDRMATGVDIDKHLFNSLQSIDCSHRARRWIEF